MVWPSQGSSTCGYRQPFRSALWPTNAQVSGLPTWLWVHQSHSLNRKGLPSNGGEVWGEGALLNPLEVLDPGVGHAIWQVDFLIDSIDSETCFIIQLLETHCEKALQQLTLLKPSQQIGRSNLLQSESDWSKWYFIFVGWQQEEKKTLHCSCTRLTPRSKG